MIKNKLKVEFSFDFILIGIISIAKEYKLAWKINKVLDVHLVKEPDLRIEFYNKSDIIVSNYLFETENSSLRLMKNKSQDLVAGSTQHLIPELNSFDYLMIISGFEDTFSIDELKSKLQNISEIQYQKEFDPNELKSKENLIF